MTDTVLLTGVSGFIAKRIAADLLNSGYAVRGTLRSLKRKDEVIRAVTPLLEDTTNLENRLTFAEADLTADAGWAEAMSGVVALFHTASPFPMTQPKNAEEIIRPAVDGTLRALNAAADAGVERVVLTSSMVAIMENGLPADHVLTEEDWTDPDYRTATPYDQSKTLAERAAWDFVSKHPNMKLTTINPGLVVGCPTDRAYGTSLELVERFFAGKDPAVPNIGLPIVDIVDVSAMHVAALQRPETAGKRYIASAGYHMMPEVAGWLAAAYPGRRIATRVAPVWLLRALSLFDASIKTVLPKVGITKKVSAARAEAEMGIAFTPPKDSILASAAFLAESEEKKVA